MSRSIYAAILAVAITMPGLLKSADAHGPYRATALDGQMIAESALAVAERTRTSGRCYAAVTRALEPLGVRLHGGAAYEARDLLMRDPRFEPVSIQSVDQLRLGDIIVYGRSGSHPYGHISVYEGNYEEASDHVSTVTDPGAYGGATVFRLRNETLAGQSPINFMAHNEYTPGCEPRGARRSTPRRRRVPVVARSCSGGSMFDEFRHDYRLIAGEPVERTLARGAIQLLLQSR